jgi:hypothetical protein
MGKLFALIEAMQKGKELANKESWKNAGMMTSVFSALLAAAVLFLPPEVQDVVNPAVKSQIVNGLVAFIGVLNAYTHVATSKSVGIG